MENMVDLDFFKNKRIFITGHTGFKGSWLSYILDRSGAFVKGYSLDPNTTPSLFSKIKFSNNVSSVISDIRDFKKLENEISSFSPDFIFHLAAQPIVLESYEEPKYTNEVNFNGTLNVLEAIRLNLKNTIAVFITTDKVYENYDKIQSFKETDRLGGIDPYSSSKAASELLISSYHQSYFKNSTNKVVSVRAGNVIGGGDWSNYRLFPDIIRACFENTKMELRNPSSVRPWQHVLDPLIGYLKLSKELHEKSFEFQGGWNFGPENNSSITVGEIIQVIKSRGIELDVEMSKINYNKESKFLMLDISKSKKQINWSPKWDTMKSINRTIDWYVNYYNNVNVNNLIEDDLTQFIKT